MLNIHRLLRQAVLACIVMGPFVATAQLPSAPRKLEFLSEPMRFATQEPLVELYFDKPCVMAIGIVVDRGGHVIEASVDKPACTCSDESVIEQALVIARSYAFGPSPDAPERHWARITWELKAPPVLASREQEGERLPPPEDDPTIDAAQAQVKPEFPGGEAALKTYLRDSVRYADALRTAGMQGIVAVEVVIATDGSVQNVQLKRSAHPALDREAIRLMKAMPRWRPGRNIRGPVPVRRTLHVAFKEETVVLPEWMAHIVGLDTARTKPTTRRRRPEFTNAFVGAYEATFQLKGDQGTREHRLSAWSDSIRLVLQFTDGYGPIVYLADGLAGIALLARADSLGGHAAIHRLEDMARANLIYQKKASWDSCRTLPAIPERALLGALRSACYHTEGTDTTRYWLSTITPSPIADLLNLVPVRSLEPFAVFRDLFKQEGPMPLLVEGPRLVFEVTAVQPGEQPMPVLDLRDHAVFDVREGSEALRRVERDGKAVRVTTQKPAATASVNGTPWFRVNNTVPGRTLLVEPARPTDAPPSCAICVDLLIDDLGLVNGVSTNTTKASAWCAPTYAWCEAVARTLRFTPRKTGVLFEHPQKASVCFSFGL